MVTREDERNYYKYLESDNYPPICEATKHVSHVSVPCRCDVAFPKVISICSVETRGYYEGDQRMRVPKLGKNHRILVLEKTPWQLA